MARRKVDVAIIGGGTAGMVAWRQARKHTESVLMIEGDRFGTTCARVGCMPSKLLIRAAEAAHEVRQSSRFGIEHGEYRVDGAAVMARVRRYRDQFVDGVLETIEKIPAEQRLLARARFSAPMELELENGDRIDADRIVIATGSRSHVVPMLKAAGSRLITSEAIFDWTDLPESVAVFGPGVIGLELGQALARLGVRVRMFGVGGRLGPIRDSKIREIALEAFNRDFPLDPDARVHEISASEQGVDIRFDDAHGDPVSEGFEWLLAATGRRPNVDDLGLEHSGLALDERGVPRFDPFTLQCGDSPVFIAGDANEDRPLLHEAANEGRLAGQNAGSWPQIRARDRRTPLGIVFTDPQIIQVGELPDEASAEAGRRIASGSISFRRQGRSRVMGRNLGRLVVHGEFGSGRFLGAEMAGPAAEHIAHLLAWAVEQKLTVARMLEMPFYHPVIEEGVRSALYDLNHELKNGPPPAGDCTDCGPGV
ncbi:dihydrolipoyl dehydrogenase [Wenzhouxiangella marina]|uniref:Dihydrolipoamide dehydrogenase n=1 Tax=Wenzhouxiangella marina TaxID=1579979 RepID=A0A0K0XRU8_9GAMM|nr:dihydrolipoyl dehydrogenase [Wenzhouxiangella marina]AKS40439.1 Dihydrolipoamide dehydrogenase [Wenzhouxiangella marina]MBB6088239.1 dihydrolipoamide dehydrogenase [Wenzhouxiangella marina]